MAIRRESRRAGSPVRKDELIQLRASAAEKLGFEEAANLSGLALSAWIRERLRRVAAGELEAAGHEVPFLSTTPTGRKTAK